MATNQPHPEDPKPVRSYPQRVKHQKSTNLCFLLCFAKPAPLSFCLTCDMSAPYKDRGI